jgi:hypothetical protein
LPLLDGQVHHDTHAVPMGNYVIGVGNYVIVSPSELGNYMIADTPSPVSSGTFNYKCDSMATTLRAAVAADPAES